MQSKINEQKLTDTWRRRFNDSPVPTGRLITGNKIIYDNLENGVFKIYEKTKHPFNDVAMLTIRDPYPDGVIVAEAYIHPDWRGYYQGEGVFIQKILWKDGYENLIEPMIQQILHYARYHNMFWVIGISEKQYEKCLPYAKEELACFLKKGNIYIDQFLSDPDELKPALSSKL